MSSRAEAHGDNGWKVFKKASWTTPHSGSFADWYIIRPPPRFRRRLLPNLSCFLVTGTRSRRPGQLGRPRDARQPVRPISVDVDIAPDALVGPIGDGAKSNDEVVDPFFLLCSIGCWNGICLAAMRASPEPHHPPGAWRRRRMRVADYPTIPGPWANY